MICRMEHDEITEVDRSWVSFFLELAAELVKAVALVISWLVG
jgi:hypothetical protein